MNKLDIFIAIKQTNWTSTKTNIVSKITYDFFLDSYDRDYTKVRNGFDDGFQRIGLTTERFSVQRHTKSIFSFDSTTSDLIVKRFEKF